MMVEKPLFNLNLYLNKLWIDNCFWWWIGVC
jgi:hypothetical protein